MQKNLTSETGAVLIFVLIALVVVSIISIGMINVATSERLQAFAEAEMVQAEYNAKSGTTLLTQYILDDPDAFEALMASNDTFPYTQSLEKGTFIGDFSNNTDGFLLTVQGKYRESTRVVETQFNKISTTPDYLFPKLITLSAELPDYETFSLPVINETAQNLTVNSDIEIDVSLAENKVYNQLTVNPSYQMKWITGGTDCEIIVDTLTINGDFNVKDSGRVLLFVKNNATINADFLNANENLVIFLMPDATLTIDAGGQFYSHIYGPSASVSLSDDTLFTGGIIARTFSQSGGTGADTYVKPQKITKLSEYIKYEESYYYENETSKLKTAK